MAILTVARLINASAYQPLSVFKTQETSDILKHDYQLLYVSFLVVIGSGKVVKLGFKVSVSCHSSVLATSFKDTINYPC